MFHLLISGNKDRWQGEADLMPLDRCLKSNEYTPLYLIDKYCQFTNTQNQCLTRLPALFGYEDSIGRDAHLGRILAINNGGRNVRIDYQFSESYPPIPNELLLQLQNQLDISEYELSRTHWALKDMDLGNALRTAGFPDIPFTIQQPLIKVSEHNFKVAFSFPGEVRQYIETVARLLVRRLGQNTVFYDNFYKSQLAMPSLDTALQSLYQNRAQLIVVFLSADYANKKWCGIEFRAIREIINNRQNERVMFVRFDDAPVDGVFEHDGYVDATTHAECDVAEMIQERIQLLTSYM